MQDKITLPESMVFMMVNDMNTIYGMLSNLTAMYALEKELKENRKAYLHVREEIEELCKIYDSIAEGMQSRMLISLFDCIRRDQKESKEDNKQVSPYGEEGVIMSKESFDNMIDDTICLTECVDILSENLERLVDAVSIPDDISSQYRVLCSNTRDIADDVTTRWSEMED